MAVLPAFPAHIPLSHTLLLLPSPPSFSIRRHMYLESKLPALAPPSGRGLGTARLAMPPRLSDRAKEVRARGVEGRGRRGLGEHMHGGTGVAGRTVIAQPIGTCLQSVLKSLFHTT
jgi:hypothetical protein